MMMDYVHQSICDYDKKRFIKMIVEGFLSLSKEYYEHNLRVFKKNDNQQPINLD